MLLQQISLLCTTNLAPVKKQKVVFAVSSFSSEGISTFHSHVIFMLWKQQEASLLYFQLLTLFFPSGCCLLMMRHMIASCRPASCIHEWYTILHIIQYNNEKISDLYGFSFIYIIQPSSVRMCYAKVQCVCLSVLSKLLQTIDFQHTSLLRSGGLSFQCSCFMTSCFRHYDTFIISSR